MTLREVGHLFRDLGVVDGALFLMHRILSKLTHGRAGIYRYHLIAQPTPAAIVGRRATTGSLRVRRVEAGDAVVADFPRPPAVIARRFASGATCLVAENAGRFAGFLWLAFRAYEEDEVRCRYVLVDDERCAWDFDVHVEPQYRLGRCFARLWECANEHLSARGFQWSLSRISAFNPGSLAAHARLGARKLHTASFLCLGWLQIAILSLSPFVHLSFSDHSRPVVRLAAPSPRTR